MSETDTANRGLSKGGFDTNQHTNGETSPAQGNQTQHDCKYRLSNGGHSLGRDDPLWPHYVAEAEKWDDIKMNKWNSGMDVLLLFATLFSAIVTAFVVQTSQYLQPDNAAISASALVEIAGILRSIASGEQNITTPNVPLGNFQPSTTNYLVNLVWFVSLCLSITVALLASLVKQWCNSFLSDRTAPPCNQARIRQARLDKLVSWRTELIVSALPVTMHIALALFLFGLIIFLHDLHYHIFIVAVVITAVTGAFYIGTTIVPFFVSFCPYETPLSSLKVWGYCYQVCLAFGLFICRRFFDVKAQADLTTYMSPCEKQELKTSNNTTPDEVTGHALRWIIMHSQNSETREMAIRSIAGLQSQEALEQLISNTPGVFPQVVQSFTACFSVDSTGDGEHSSFNKSIDDVSLHGEALARLVNLVTSTSSHTEPEYLAKWGVDDDTKEAVKERFQRLAKNDECSQGAALGLIGLSAWYDFVDQGESRFDRGEMVVRLSQSLPRPLANGLCSRILHALMVESAYWTPDVDGKRRASILNHLVDLIPTAPTGELRSKLACSLAVLMLGLNPSLHLQRSSMYSHTELEAGSARKPALRLVDYYIESPNNVIKDEQALLLFALTGLMRHYEHCDFDDRGQASMKIVAEQLSKIDDLGKSRRITLPKATGLPLDFDIRRYFVETLVLYLKQARPPFQSQTTDDSDILVSLLESVKNKRQIWVDHGSLILPPVIQILAQTDSMKLKRICLKTIITYWEFGPSLLYSRMLLSYEVPQKLVKLINDAQVQNSDQPQEIGDLRLTIPVFFGNLSEQVEAGQLASHTDTDMLASFLERILKENLLETFVRHGLDLPISPQTSLTPVDQATAEVHSPRPARPATLYHETRNYLERHASPTKDGGRTQRAEARNASLLKKLFELRDAKIALEPQRPQTPNPEQRAEASNSISTEDTSGAQLPENSQSGNSDLEV